MNEEWHRIEFSLGGGRTDDGTWEVLLTAKCDHMLDAIAFRVFLQQTLDSIATNIKASSPPEDVKVERVPAEQKTH